MTQLDSLVFKDTEFETNNSAANQIETFREHQSSLNFSASSFNLANTLRNMLISDNQSNRNSTTDLLDLSNYTKLEFFSNSSVYRDADLSFDFSGCTSIRGLDLYRCDLDAAELNSIFEHLPTLNSFDGLYRIDQCTGESACDVSIALEKK